MSTGADSFARALGRDAPVAAVALARALQAAGLRATPERSAAFIRGAALLRPVGTNAAPDAPGTGAPPGKPGPAGTNAAPDAPGKPGPAAATLARRRERDALYWAARLTFVSARDELERFDAVFAAVVDGVEDPAGESRGDPNAPASQAAPRRAPAAGRPAGADGAPGGAAPGPARERPVAAGASASEAERLADVRLNELDDDELALVAGLIRALAVATPPRRTRRSRTARHGERLQVRATLRRSHRTGGDPVRQLYRRRRERPRRLVALLDVSGSMAPYARAYLLLLEGAARGARAEVFVFATRLTRVTRSLREGRPRTAPERASAAAPDWAGGTRLGAALQAFNDRHGRRGMARDAVVVIFSDGWERGDPALLGRELERLARLAYRIVWVNPRVAAPGFAPVTGGMAAALPHTDELVSGHSAAALEDVVAAIGRPR
jgi:uncharacterized protein with von Willebrand factor type A (vWA) domain